MVDLLADLLVDSLVDSLVDTLVDNQRANAKLFPKLTYLRKFPLGQSEVVFIDILIGRFNFVVCIGFIVFL